MFHPRPLFLIREEVPDEMKEFAATFELSSDFTKDPDPIFKRSHFYHGSIKAPLKPSEKNNVEFIFASNEDGFTGITFKFHGKNVKEELEFRKRIVELQKTVAPSLDIYEHNLVQFSTDKPTRQKLVELAKLGLEIQKLLNFDIKPHTPSMPWNLGPLPPKDPNNPYAPPRSDL